MKKCLFWLLFIIAGVVCIGLNSNSASAHIPSPERYSIQNALHLQVDQTPLPTVEASLVAVETPNSQALPPLGRNAGLVIGASILVLIIIGGVLGSQRRAKH